MTTQEIVQEVFEGLSEPSDLEINATPGFPATFDLTLAGSQAILRRVNQALIRIANWEYSDKHILRIPSLYSRLIWKCPVLDEQFALAFGDDYVDIEGWATNYADSCDGWTVEITTGTGVGQLRIVTSSSISAGNLHLEVNTDWDTNPDATSKIALYKGFADFVSAATADTYLEQHIPLAVNTELCDILKIRDLDEGVDLVRAPFADTLPGAMRSTRPPVSFYIYGNRIQFNAGISETKSYEIFYYRQPTLLTSATQVPDIPIPFHEAIVFYTIHKFQMRAQDWEGQYAMKRNLVDLMNSLRPLGAMSNEMEHASLVPYGED